MATDPKQSKIKRVAVLVELEDGSTMALYAEPDPLHNDAEVMVTTDRPVRRKDFQVPGDGARSTVGELVASVHVDYLHEFRVMDRMPATTLAALDLLKSAVNA